MTMKLEWQKTDDCSKDHTDNGEAPYISERTFDMVFDIHICQTDTKQCSRYHWADEGCAVTADNHSDCDWVSFYTEGSADRDHNWKHTIEVGVSIEAQC